MAVSADIISRTGCRKSKASTGIQGLEARDAAKLPAVLNRTEPPAPERIVQFEMTVPRLKNLV